MKNKFIKSSLILCILASTLTGCKKEAEKVTPNIEKVEKDAPKSDVDYAALVNDAMKDKAINHYDSCVGYPVVFKTFEKDGKLNIIANYETYTYKYIGDKKLFSLKNKKSYPAKLVFENKNGKWELSELKEPDGTTDSLLELVDGDKELATVMNNYGETEEDFAMRDKLLAEMATSKTFNYEVDLDNLPIENLLALENLEEIPKNTVLLIDKDLYEDSKKNPEKYPSIDAYLYSKNTKILYTFSL